MNEKKWDRVLHFTPLMDIMNIQDPKPFHFDVPGEHWKFVKFPFMVTPVVAFFPLVDQTFHVGERGAIVPASIAYFVGKVYVGKFAMKEGKSVIWH